MKSIFIICQVRDALPSYIQKLEGYAEQLEAAGHRVHLPHRDTNQLGGSLEICTQNEMAIDAADEVHVFFTGGSQGSFFDLGVAFSKRKKVVIVESIPLTEGKSFQNFLNEYKQWHERKAADGVVE